MQLTLSKRNWDLGGGEKTSKNDLGRNWKSDIKVFYAVVNKSSSRFDKLQD